MSQSLSIMSDIGSGQGLSRYLAEVNSAPILSAEEEKSLACRYSNDNDLEAVRQLVFSHLRYVVSVARGFSGYGLPLGDLIQEGNVGLMKAVKRFDHDRDVRLVSFAVHWIKSEIYNLMLFQRDKNIDIDYILPEENRVISQSDVGFHNMLIGKNKVYFLDFEYAGWDDPGKLFSDLLLQPDNNFPIKHFKILSHTSFY